jgi:hypothetical protein
MAQIEVFKCDVCKCLYEDGRPIFYVDDFNKDSIIIRNYQKYSSMDKAVCSGDCAKAALDAWLAKRHLESAVVEHNEEGKE